MKLSKACLNYLIITTLTALSLSGYASEKNDDYCHLLLAGGALKICSNYSPSNCKETDWIDTLSNNNLKDGREVVRVDLSKSAQSVAIFQRFITMAKQTHNAGEQPLILFSTSASVNPYDAVIFYQSVFQQLGAKSVWLPLDVAVVKARSEGRCEDLSRVQSELLNNNDLDERYPELYQQQVNFCKSPQQTTDLLAQANGLFFNGGDQNLTRQAWVRADNSPSHALTLLSERVANRQTVVGGTSAGTAVQSAGPMISNGSSKAAMQQGSFAVEPPPRDCDLNNRCPAGLNVDSLTYNPAGGTGLFRFGTLDTHFSERSRQARLMRLAADTSTALAVGVDETTALVINLDNGAFDVIGEHGVFIVRDATAHADGVAAEVSYLWSGSQGSLLEQAAP